MRVHFYLITAFAILTVCVLSAAQAAPITFKLTGTMTESLNVSDFNTSAFTWTIKGDTSSRKLVDLDISTVRITSQSLDIDGLGTLKPTATMYAGMLLTTDAFLVTDVNLTEGIAFSAPQLMDYDGVSAMDPTPVTFLGISLLTTDRGGLFIFKASDLMFEASTVPEPITLSLFGAGLVGAGALRRRRKAMA